MVRYFGIKFPIWLSKGVLSILSQESLHLSFVVHFISSIESLSWEETDQIPNNLVGIECLFLWLELGIDFFIIIFLSYLWREADVLLFYWHTSRAVIHIFCRKQVLTLTVLPFCAENGISLFPDPTGALILH